MTSGAEINFGGHEKFILCEFEKGTGAREIYPTLDQMNKVRRKNFKGFSGRNRNFKRIFRPKTGDLQKKKSSSQKRHKIRCQSTKTLICASICAPEARSLLISSGHSPRLGGHNFRLGGTRSQLGGYGPAMPPCAAGSGH